MRTTLTIDEDVAVILEELRRTRTASLKQLINEALRQGLRQMQAPPRRSKPFRTRPAALGQLLIGNIDSIAEALSIAEGDAFK